MSLISTLKKEEVNILGLLLQSKELAILIAKELNELYDIGRIEFFEKGLHLGRPVYLYYKENGQVELKINTYSISKEIQDKINEKFNNTIGMSLRIGKCGFTNEYNTTIVLNKDEYILNRRFIVDVFNLLDYKYSTKILTKE